MCIRSSILLLCLAGWLISSASTVSADESKPFFSQPPQKKSGGCLAIAQPMRETGGWIGVYRAADDFLLTKGTEIGEVVWWGCSYDGQHGEDDGLDQVLGFAIEIYEHDPKTEQPGRFLHRTIVPLHETAPRRTGLQCFGRSDVLRFKGALVAPFQADAETRYWLSVTAYLSGEPMWTWFQSEKGNSSNAIDYGVNGKWGDGPRDWQPMDLAFELRAVGGETEDSINKSNKPPADKPAIERLIKQLGSNKYIERQAAEKRLAAIGEASAPFLAPHAKHDDPEIRYRVRRLLTKCDFFPAAPPMKTHTLEEGEEISDLVTLHAVSGEAIIKANALGEQPLRQGMMLFIP